MRIFPRPRIVCSRCLEFDHCRYNGDCISNSFVRALEPFVDFITVCPECDIGLGIPRKPVRLAMEKDELRLFQPATGLDCTRDMKEFSSRWLASTGQVDGFILKFRSPSCGAGNVKVYNSKAPDAASHSKGVGMFASLAREARPLSIVEDEGRLNNFDIREHFLSRIFASAALGEIGRSGSMGNLVTFHSRMKYLLMGYSQGGLKTLGKVVANHEGLPFPEVLAEYEARLAEVMAKPPRFTSMINALQHVFGGVTKQLTPPERALFVESVEEYRDERIPLSALIHMLKAWAVRFSNTYVLDQFLLEPFPRALVEMKDSGKGRKD